MSFLEEIINAIALVSIIIGALLGIIGSATVTKDKSGKLTRWGKIIILGIFITAVISIAKALLEKEVKQEAKIKAQEEHIKELNREANNFKQVADSFKVQIEKWDKNFKQQDSLLSKSDASLKSQIELQEQSNDNLSRQDTIITRTDSLNKNQSEIYTKQIGILAKQDSVLTQVARTLNPVLPFAVEFIVRIKVDNSKIAGDSFDKAHQNLVKILNEINLKSDIELSKEFGIERISDGAGFYYKLTNKYKNFNDYNFLDSITVFVKFIKRNKVINDFDTVFSSKFYCFNDTIGTGNKFGWWDINYYPNTKEYEILLHTVRYDIIKDKRIMVSTMDLHGIELNSLVIGLPYIARITRFTLLFPPLYSNIISLDSLWENLQVKYIFN
jgi:hypothetical protein